MTLKQPIFRKAAGGHLRSGFSAVALAVAMVVAGCERGRSLSIANETDEPLYRQAKLELLAGRHQVALEDFQKVIAKRGGDAPESHLEAGQIYLRHFKEHVMAIYHFERYRQLRPTAAADDQARTLIDAATKEFARKIPGNQFEDKLDLLDQLEALKAENQTLRAELARLGVTVRPATQPTFGNAAGYAGNQAPATTPPAAGPIRPAAVTPVPEPRGVATQPQQPPVRSPVYAAPPEPATAGGQTPVVTEPSTASQGRNHVVQRGETLYGISTRYYGSGARWPAILDANRDQLRSEGDLKIGMVLRIP
jgi:LysM repeat protein